MPTELFREIEHLYNDMTEKHCDQRMLKYINPSHKVDFINGIYNSIVISKQRGYTKKLIDDDNDPTGELFYELVEMNAVFFINDSEEFGDRVFQASEQYIDFVKNHLS